jgi:hypothetical protein
MSFNMIDLFMWGYQRHFQIGVEDAAERVFEKLDPGFQVKVFLLGVLRVPSPEWHPICLEPPTCGFAPSDFSSLLKDAAVLRAADGDENLMSTTEVGMMAIERRRDHRANRAAVMALLKKADPSGDKNYYFSGFVPVGKYDVGVILSIKHRDGLRCYQLPKSHAEDRYGVPVSIVDAAAGEFLGECAKSLYVPDPEKVDRFEGSRAEEILRKAGSRLMEVPNFAAQSWGGLYGLFNACNYIASLSYEGAESVGGMIVAKIGHPNISTTIQLSRPLRLQKYRAIRKLLEITTTGESILTDGEFVTGFGRMSGVYDPSSSDLFMVRFTGHHKWEVLHDDHPMMVVKHEVPRMPSPSLNKAEFISSCGILFPDIEPEKINFLYELALGACKQRHGTILVITPLARDETERLSSQSTGIVPTVASEEILRCVSSIDGAILIDMDGVCHAIGVILDGSAIQEGDTGRGARYNSTLRYIHGMRERSIPCLAVVVSEDGTAELMPDLPRRLARNEIAIKEKEIADLMKKEDHDFDKAFDLMQWMEAHRFYFSEAFCVKANEFADKHEKALQKERQMIFQRAKFVPNPGMSDAFLI